MGLVYKPKQCKECQSFLICGPCAQKSRNQCPMCKKSNVFQDISGILKGLLNQVKVICKNEGCSLQETPISYEELAGTHSEECTNYKCPFDCGIGLLNKDMAKKHIYFECPNNLTQCFRCHEVFIRGESRNHDCIEIIK